MGFFSRNKKTGISSKGKMPPAPAAPIPELDPVLGDEELREVLAAFRAGEWQRVEAFLDQRQDPFVERLLLNESDIEFTTPWVEHAPSARSLSFHGYAQVAEGWKARGTGTASTVSSSGWKGLKQWVGDAEETLVQASELDPDDAWPWAVLITTAMGLNKSIAVKQQRFDEAHRRSPFHPYAVGAMTQATAPKWGGKTEPYLEFGNWIGEHAPVDAPVRADLIRVYYELAEANYYEIKDTDASSGKRHVDLRNHMASLGEEKMWRIGDDFVASLGDDGIAPAALVGPFNWLLFATRPTNREQALATTRFVKAADNRPTEVPWLNINSKPAKRFQNAIDQSMREARQLM